MVNSNSISECAPKYMNKKDPSCLNREALVVIAKNMNNKMTSSGGNGKTKKNKLKKIRIHQKKSELWSNIRNTLSDRCDRESCWLNTEYGRNIKGEYIDNFRPVQPKSWKTNKTEWLSTLDIMNVLEQYSDKYPDFELIGPVPIDFDKKVDYGQCIVNELCSIDIKRLVNKGIHHVGIVFNLDAHDEPGSHWVALYVQLKETADSVNPLGAYFYDSYGTPPVKEIRTLMKRLESQYNVLHPKKKFILNYNKIRHQYKNSECGVYSTHFIIQLLENTKFLDHCKKIVSDDNINKMRDVYFRKI